MMKQLSLWPWVLRTEPPVLMSDARSAGVVERESYHSEYLALSQAGLLGRALERHALIRHGLNLSGIAPVDMFYNVENQEYFRVPPNTSDKRRFDGSRNDLISQQLNLPLLEYCTCLNQKPRTGLLAVLLECFAAECCVALPVA